MQCEHCEEEKLEWINVNDYKPEHGKKVMATYLNSHGKRRTIMAVLYGRFEEETGVDMDWYEEHPENDEVYLPAGWYEQIDNWSDYTDVYVSEASVTHWMPLPAPPQDA